MPTYEPNLALFRQAFGNSVTDCRAELIKSALGWSRVYRVTLAMQGHPTRTSVILKIIDSNGRIDRYQAEREYRFYETLHPKLAIPKAGIYLLLIDAETHAHVMVMEDLAPRLRIPAHPFQWTGAEIKSVLRAYAQLHTTQFETLEYEWLVPRHESLVDLEKIPEHAAIVQRAGIWNDLPHIHDLIAYARESIKKYANEKPSLLHGDTTPANAGLPPDLNLRQAATLIDWQDVGPGMPEFDLAYMDLQPFDSARLIPRSDLLDLYWRYRAEFDPAIPSPGERRLRQLHADLITALWLTASASRVTLHPFPLGSYQQIHWASQYGIVYNRLNSLAEEINSA